MSGTKLLHYQIRQNSRFSTVKFRNRRNSSDPCTHLYTRIDVNLGQNGVERFYLCSTFQMALGRKGTVLSKLFDSNAFMENASEGYLTLSCLPVPVVTSKQCVFLNS